MWGSGEIFALSAGFLVSTYRGRGGARLFCYLYYCSFVCVVVFGSASFRLFPRSVDFSEHSGSLLLVESGFFSSGLKPYLLPIIRLVPC